jgi:hypothetical protein
MSPPAQGAKPRRHQRQRHPRPDHREAEREDEAVDFLGPVGVEQKGDGAEAERQADHDQQGDQEAERGAQPHMAIGLPEAIVVGRDRRRRRCQQQHAGQGHERQRHEFRGQSRACARQFKRRRQADTDQRQNHAIAAKAVGLGEYLPGDGQENR